MVAPSASSSSAYFLLILVLLGFNNYSYALVQVVSSDQTNAHHDHETSRRNVLIGTACTAASLAGLASSANANTEGKPASPTIRDPEPLRSMHGVGPKGGDVSIPRVGYSFYKTAPDQAARCASLALTAGVRHLDIATQYDSNAEIAKTLRRYLDVGLTGLVDDESAGLRERLDLTRLAGEDRAVSAGDSRRGATGRRSRRETLFLSHKISNAEQSNDAASVRRSVKNAIATLGCSYLDMASIHSPLTDTSRRLSTYRALLDLRDEGVVRSVGVCNYGSGPLTEILRAGLPLPAVDQLELSPFYAHGDVVEFCRGHGVAVGCAAWSKLSGVDGPAEGWDVVSGIARRKGVVKAQVLVRWALQKGYVCVPRSGVGSKLERFAIAENSYGGVNLDGSLGLTSEEMGVLDGLDVSYKAGRLGRRDGWDDSDVIGPEWDPTDVV